MPAIEVNASGTVCRKCGVAYGRLKGNFPISYAQLHKGVGYLPYCRSCVDSMYDAYLAECGDTKRAVRQMCRKLDLYWNEKSFEAVEKTTSNRSMMTGYIARVNGLKQAGKSYDDTLREENAMWEWNATLGSEPTTQPVAHQHEAEDAVSVIEVPEDVIEFWGSDFEPEFVMKLDKRYKHWTDGAELDKGSVSLYKQICILEEMINRDAAEGKPVDKNMNMLNTLLGSLNQKPVQKKEADSSSDNTTFGEWIRKWENLRPIPDPDPELRDVDGIVRYITVFFFGHLARMLGIKNAYSKLYDEEIAKLRVDRPEFDGDDDETMFNEIFSSGDDG